MGEVVGAGLIAHVPTIVLPEEIRRELNNGEDSTLPAGLEQLRKEVFETLDYDTVVVLDSHWATTVEFVVTAHARRQRAVHLRGAAPGNVPAAVRLSGRPGAGASDRREGRPAQHLDHRDRRRSPADLLRDHQRVGVPRPGPAGQAVDLDRRLPDRGHRGQPAARPGPRRRDRRVRPQGRADRLRRAVAHVLAAAQAARSRGGGRRTHLHRRRRGGRLRAARRGSARATMRGCSKPCRTSTGSSPKPDSATT